MSKDYEQHKQSLRDEQGELSREELISQLQQARDDYDSAKPKFTDIFDPDTAKPITHRWVDRGQVMSCEGAAHGNHRAFKRR